MNDNLPDTDFKEKKEKKRGALGWLRDKLGFGSRGAMGGAGINPSAMRVLGGAKFGASAGLGSFLAGNLGTIVTVAMVAVAGGIYLAHNSSGPVTNAGAFSSNKTKDNYVPAILRSQAANGGSSLDMFMDTNKGAARMDVYDADGYDKNGYDKDGYDRNGYNKNGYDRTGYDKNGYDKDGYGRDGYNKDGLDRNGVGRNGAQNPGQGGMVQQMVGKLQGGSFGALTSSLSGGANKFSNMGGIGNKFNQGAIGAKTGFVSGIGAGFQAVPRYDQLKGKITAMKPSSRPVLTSGKAVKKANFGAGSFGQAKGLRATQQSYTGREIDQMAGTQSKAWEGATPDGSVSGGAGISGGGAGNGGAGIMSSPSLDSASGGGAGGGMNTPDEPTIPDASSPLNVSPWTDMLSKIMTLVLISAVLSVIGALLRASHHPLLQMIGMMLCLAAAALAVMAIIMAIQVMSSFGQAMLGMVYMIGGGVALAAAVKAMQGNAGEAVAPIVYWLAAAAGAMGLIASMLGK